MKKWWSLSLSLALIGSAVLPVSAFAAQTAPVQQQPAETDPAATEELTPAMIAALDYADALEAIIQYEEKAANAFNAVGMVSASNRKAVYSTLNNTIIPNYSKFYYHLKQIKPSGKEVTKLHGYYLQGAALQLEGMQLIKKSLYGAKINWTTYNQGQSKLKSGKAKIDLFLDGFDAYMKKLQ
ncbi:hypothetical protein [Saccharibacillus sacchari]|uniref:Uncharacterized protein n=1 Tax=Saccharibacillus sacchari TaxID=456493 RepID=A0ACC6P7R7_9BACL